MFLKDLSDLIYTFHYSQADKDDVNMSKIAFLDYFGVTYRGFKEKPSQIALKSLNEISQENNILLKSSIIGDSNIECGVLNAGFINGISSHVLELDDGHRLAHIHLGSVVFSTALALAEPLNISGKEFIQAVIVGYKVGILLGQFINPEHRNNGFHTTATLGTLVAGVVASKILKLDKNKIANTLALCITQSSGLLESDHGGSMAKTLHVGKAVHTAIMSAFLAKNGFTGSETIMEGYEGFLNTMVFTNNTTTLSNDLNHLLQNIDDIKLKDIYFKRYPFCRHIHSALETILKLRDKIKGIDHIECVIVKTYDIAAQHNNYEVYSIEELKQSLPYAIAIALIYGDVDIDNINKLISQGLFSKKQNNNNLVKKLVDKIKIISDKNLNNLYPQKRPAVICIKLDNNMMFSDSTYIAKGDIPNPLTIDEIVDKFRKLNPDYDISKLHLIEHIEEYNMNYIVDNIK